MSPVDARNLTVKEASRVLHAIKVNSVFPLGTLVLARVNYALYC